MSTMKCPFLSRLVLCGLAASLILLSPALVRADAITTFDVSGTVKNISGGTLISCAKGATCGFSGMFQVDTTTGTIESSSLDINLPGLEVFTSLGPSSRNGNDWEIGCFSPQGMLSLEFTTAPTAGSLVGFTGGSIVGVDALPDYVVIGGTIAPTPEPSSLVLFAGGLLVLGLTWRFRQEGRPSI
jgi:hypothetical protein